MPLVKTHLSITGTPNWALTELTYLFGRDMATRRSGHILLVASLLAFQAIPSYAAYAATKAYVLALGWSGRDQPLPGAYRDGVRCGGWRYRLALVASTHDEAATGRCERYPGAFTS